MLITYRPETRGRTVVATLMPRKEIVGTIKGDTFKPLAGVRLTLPCWQASSGTSPGNRSAQKIVALGGSALQRPVAKWTHGNVSHSGSVYFSPPSRLPKRVSATAQPQVARSFPAEEGDAPPSQVAMPGKSGGQFSSNRR